MDGAATPEHVSAAAGADAVAGQTEGNGLPNWRFFSN